MADDIIDGFYSEDVGSAFWKVSCENQNQNNLFGLISDPGDLC